MRMENAIEDEIKRSIKRGEDPVQILYRFYGIIWNKIVILSEKSFKEKEE